MKNGTSVYTGICTSANNNYYNNLNINFNDGDKMQLYNSQAGLPNQSGTRITLIFASVGIRGDTGPQGLTGVDGQSSSITIGSTSNLPAGSSAYVTNTGTALNPILNFGLVAGDKGDKGSTGAAGADGADGKDGTNGDSSGATTAAVAAAASAATAAAAAGVAAGSATTAATSATASAVSAADAAASAAANTTSIQELQQKTADISYGLQGTQFARSVIVGAIDINGTNGKITCSNIQTDNCTIDSNGNINTTGNLICNEISSNELHSYTDTFGTNLDLGIHANNINVGSVSTSSTNIEASTINIGTGSLLNSVNIGNSFSSVTISCYNNNAVKVSNFFDQF
jgi:hypothetical protein